MLESILKQECDLQFFHDNGYIRKKCKSCGDYFWTLDSNTELCGDQPCVKFSFIRSTATRKSFSLSEVRESFLTFFEKHNHSKVRYPETGNRCPVIARWRSDIYLTIASIADFQPHVTSGVVPAPANPLIISQPCIRLNDLEEVGRSGRHLTMFEMMGHHAFNKNIDEIYWKEETVTYCDEYFQKYIGIPRDEINYKEQLWIGGGNAGPCIEVLAGGLEIATLVFMNMKEEKNGKIIIEGKKYAQNPLNIVDTGYGLERIAWYTQGTPTIYETVFPELINFLIEHTKEKMDMASIYALADHSKCLAFMLGDGIVPSNVKAGYLARLIIRRSLRFLEKLKLHVSLRELVDMELDILDKEFPSLKQRKTQIDEILDIETKRFSETLTKGERLIRRLLKENKTIDKNALITLYDTYGMPSDIVQNIAKKEGVTVKIPDNFDSMIAELHSHEKKEEIRQKIRSNLSETKALYYENHYTKEFDARVLWKNKTNNGTEIILDQTAFYPDGGGQPADKGVLITNEKQVSVKHVEKEGNAIIHVIDGNLDVGDEVHGKLDWDHRYMLMKHHTGTHVVNGALRKLLGEHIWQAGSQLTVNEARFDFSHYKSITEKEIKEIEKMANDFIRQAVDIEKKVMKRNDAEKKFGFRLYQGGVPPGNLIRVLNIPGVDVEACGGTHLNNTSEIEKIRIVKAERIQDGVNRIIFAAGKMVDVYQKEEEELYYGIVENLKPLFEIKYKDNVTEQLIEASKIFSVHINQLNKTLERFKKVEEDRLIQTTKSLTKYFKLSREQYKQLQKVTQPSRELQKATELTAKNFKLLQKAIQPSKELQKATELAAKQYAEQFKQLQKAIQPSKELQKATELAAKQYAEQFKQLQKAIQPSKELQKATELAAEKFKRLNQESQNLINEINRINKEKMKNDLIDVSNYLFEQWKKGQKEKKTISSDEIEILKNKAEIIPRTKIKVITAISEFDSTALAGAITKEKNYVVHLYDGKKLTSSASENVDIDLRKIAPEIGRILGGSGGGKPKLTQCGGPKKEKVKDALEKATQLTIKKLEKQ